MCWQWQCALPPSKFDELRNFSVFTDIFGLYNWSSNCCSKIVHIESRSSFATRDYNSVLRRRRISTRSSRLAILFNLPFNYWTPSSEPGEHQSETANHISEWDFPFTHSINYSIRHLKTSYFVHIHIASQWVNNVKEKSILRLHCALNRVLVSVRETVRHNIHFGWSFPSLLHAHRVTRLSLSSQLWAHLTAMQILAKEIDSRYYWL